MKRQYIKVFVKIKIIVCENLNHFKQKKFITFTNFEKLMDAKTNFYVGETVRFLERPEDGIIVSISSDHVVVEDKDGFKWPLLPKQIVKIHNLNNTKEEKTVLHNYEKADTEKAVSLAIIENDKIKAFKLINKTQHHFLFALYKSEKNHEQLTFAGYLSPQTSSNKISFDDFQELKHMKLIWQSLAEKSSTLSEQQVLHIKLKPEEILNTPLKYDELAEMPSTFMVLLKEENINNILLLDSLKKEPVVLKKEENPELKIKTTERKIIDLHFEELVENEIGYQPHQKLKIQLDKFEKEIDFCIVNKVKKLVVIHGVGKGVLKNEIMKKLKEMKQVQYRDADYFAFGYGATEIEFL